jgi:GntR family transcriptional regulator
VDNERPIIDKNSIVPLYYQLKEYIKRQIDARQYKELDLIPSERELSERFDINRMTVRQACNELVQEGILHRQRGVGTYVSKVKINQPLSKLTNFSFDMLDKGITPGSRDLGTEVILAEEEIASRLQIAKGDKVIRVFRIRTGDGEPMALERSYLNYEVARPLEGLNMENRSLYEALAEKCGVKLVRAQQTIEISYIDPEDAHYLEIDPGEAFMLIKRVTYALGIARPVEYVSSIYRADRYKFSIEMAV